MKIARPALPTLMPWERPVQAASPPPLAPDPKDGFSHSAPQVMGSWGAMVGALSGRATTVLGTAGHLASAGAAVAGPVGALVGGAVGLVGGYLLESKTRVGRLLGGLVGGAIGSASGVAARGLGYQPSERMAQECRGFSLSSLPKKLLNPDYTSHPNLTREGVAAALEMAQPGDVIITNDDHSFKLELMQKAAGCSGSWTHLAIVDEEKKVMDILITHNKPTRWPLEYIFEDNSHATLLRPKYAGPESVTRTLDAIRSKFDNTTYDAKFDMKTDDAQSCQEMICKGLREGAPEVEIRSRYLLGREIVSADEFLSSPSMEVKWTTGSDFWTNWLSKFN